MNVWRPSYDQLPEGPINFLKTSLWVWVSDIRRYGERGRKSPVEPGKMKKFAALIAAASPLNLEKPLDLTQKIVYKVPSQTKLPLLSFQISKLSTLQVPN